MERLKAESKMLESIDEFQVFEAFIKVLAMQVYEEESANIRFELKRLRTKIRSSETKPPESKSEMTTVEMILPPPPPHHLYHKPQQPEYSKDFRLLRHHLCRIQTVPLRLPAFAQFEWCASSPPPPSFAPPAPLGAVLVQLHRGNTKIHRSRLLGN